MNADSDSKMESYLASRLFRKTTSTITRSSERNNV